MQMTNHSSVFSRCNTNITTLGPLGLPMREKLLFLYSLLANKLFLVPNFKLAFDQFCIPAGSKTVTCEVGKNLQLLPGDVDRGF